MAYGGLRKIQTRREVCWSVCSFRILLDDVATIGKNRVAALYSCCASHRLRLGANEKPGFYSRDPL